jgi:ribonuclease HI
VAKIDGKIKEVEIYTDGSCIVDKKNGGWAAMLLYKGKKRIICGKVKDATNNQMELLAIAKALSCLTENTKVKLYSDSMYAVDAINKWMKNWSKKSFGNIKNKYLMIWLHDLMTQHHIEAIHVKAHNGNKNNERIDDIAREKAREL